MNLLVKQKARLYSLFFKLAQINPLLSVRLYGRFVDLQTRERRFFRSRMLRKASMNLASVMQLVKFKQNIMVRSDGSVFVESDGIFLNTRLTNRYFKVTKKTSGNEGYYILENIKKWGLTPQSVVDIGANFGEISLYICKQLPGCRILSIEASKENFDIMLDNISNQYFDTTSIIPLHIAVTNYTGTVEITKNLGSENTIINDEDNEQHRGRSVPREIISCDTLLNILNKYSFFDVDFIKIDIEGAEPLLTQDLIKIKPKIMYIEFSNNTTFEKNKFLAEELLKGDYNCFRDDGYCFKNAEAVFHYLEETYKSNNYVGCIRIAAANLWFVLKEFQNRVNI